jgi:lantibiotic transport system ATP-binding protein
MNIIETNNLTKSYTGFTAVSKVNLHIKKGSIYGFLGPNGAGKSTTMKMLLGLIKPTSGSFSIDGMNYSNDRLKILKQIGSFIEAPAFYGNLTGEENLYILQKILGLPKSSVEEALELTGLTKYRNRLARKYSLGMKQRLGLAGALIGRPPILILDEPTNGLDPVGIHEIRTLIRSLPQKFDCTVLVSSHLLFEIEQIADDIGILNHGNVLFEGTLEELKTDARSKGFPTENLEDTFLAIIDEDNRKRSNIL